jgi:outer membrane lipoprotein-sorting protein
MLVVSCLSTVARADGSLTAQQYLVRSDLTTKVIDSSTAATMTLTDASGDVRVRKLNIFTRLEPDGFDNMRLLQFTGPADIDGTVTLLIEKSDGDDDMWIYLPAMEKIRRLVADNKRDSFVGSDLTFGDIIGLKPSEWVASFVREDTLDGKRVHVIQSVPVSSTIEGQTGYSKRIAWIDDQSLIALRTDYWDEDGNFLKTILADNIIPIPGAPGKWQFLHVSAQNKQTGHQTDLKFDNYQANVKLPDRLFSPNMLDSEN